MPFFIDPKDPVSKVIDGITFNVRVFDGRERGKFSAHLLPLSRVWSHNDEDELVSISETDIGHMEEIIRIGICGWGGEGAPQFRTSKDGYLSRKSLGLIPFERWNELLTAVVEVNSVTEDDEGNSQ
jgi:hypothetical protein